MLNLKNKQFLKGIVIGFCGFLIAYYILNLTNCFGKNSSHIENIQKLSRQAARWSTAAAQDDSPLISVLHANYGAGYLWALKDIATAKQIKNATGIDLDQFTNEIVKIQDNATQEMIKVCPKYAPPRTYLSQIGGE